MATWFKASTFGIGIVPVDVLRDTEQFLLVHRANGTPLRVAKASQWGCHFPTWADAHAYLMNRATRKLESARRGLQIAQSELGNVKGMKPPADSEVA